MRRFLLATAFLAGVSPALAVPISQLPAAPSASTTDAVPTASASCTGGDCKVTIQQIINLALGAANTWTQPQTTLFASPSAFSGDYALLTGQIGSTSGQQIYWDAIRAPNNPNCGAGCTAADAVRGVATAVAGSTTASVNAVGAYMLNMNQNANNGGNGVALFATGISAVDGAQTWGLNLNVEDSATPFTVSNGNNRQLYNEFDFNVTSPHTFVNGLVMQGASVSTPALANAITVGNLNIGYMGDTQNGPSIPWNNAFQTEDASAIFALTVGLAGGRCSPSSGACPANLNSQYLGLAMSDASGAKHYVLVYGTPLGLETTAPAFLSSANNAMSIGGLGRWMNEIWSRKFVLEPQTVATLPACNSFTKGSITAATDGSSTTSYQYVQGGGNFTVLVMCDGAGWVVH